MGQIENYKYQIETRKKDIDNIKKYEIEREKGDIVQKKKNRK